VIRARSSPPSRDGTSRYPSCLRDRRCRGVNPGRSGHADTLPRRPSSRNWLSRSPALPRLSDAARPAAAVVAGSAAAAWWPRRR
jgi:hypothetical protein